ncbi:WecB/TagA/CpsF family glycosyltransferase [Aeromicrobium piscarium]|uniref:WecB/TagA/CpsF family glycosyltransferase n=1 Tax=Aeromicrobium piscarium TaxID=2590901 RepID=A0A554RJI0_9ACTN|nr:WecB/TagA/CpsF family glycosyltransferase [Aeromicrobium piscarium]
MHFGVHRVGNVPFCVTNIDAAVNWLTAAAKGQSAVSVRLANAYCVALAEEDPVYGDLLRRAGVNFPDGTPVVWTMRAQGNAAARRVRGPSFFIRAIEEQAATGLRPFFLGASGETLDLLTSVMTGAHPDLDIAGSYSPPFAPVSDEYIDDCLNAIGTAAPDLVWVGLGTPKQDFVSTALAERLGIPCIGVGAAFDFAAGTVREAPKFIQNSGFEWAYRFASEPRRLWRRYLVGNLSFLGAVKRYWRVNA